MAGELLHHPARRQVRQRRREGALQVVEAVLPRQPSVLQRGKRLDALEKSDREAVAIPTKLDAAIAEQADQRSRDRESAARERVAAERLVRVEAAVGGLHDQVRQVMTEVLRQRADRDRGGNPYRAFGPASPAFRPN